MSEEEIRQAIADIPWTDERHLNIALRLIVDDPMGYIAWLKEPMSCGHPRAAVRSSNPNATGLTTCWCAGCAEEAE